MNIVLPDSDTLGKGLDFSVLEKFGTVRLLGHTPQKKVGDALADCDIAIINKTKMNEESLKNAKNLKLICVFATGFDNVDTVYCRERGIAVCNVTGYSTDSVAQLTFTMALAIANHLKEYTDFVKSGEYTKSGIQNHLEPQFYELCGKMWGVIGCGNIGGRVAEIAKAFGCEVIVNKRSPSEKYTCVSVDEICERADIISLHVPLTPETESLINVERLEKMKNTAILINAARGAVTDEAAVAEAVLNGKIGGFGTDVYSVEPMQEGHPFYKIMGLPNVCLTPHMGWGAYEARVRCLNEIEKNISAFLNGKIRNRVDL